MFVFDIIIIGRDKNIIYKSDTYTFMENTYRSLAATKIR